MEEQALKYNFWTKTKDLPNNQPSASMKRLKSFLAAHHEDAKCEAISNAGFDWTKYA